MGLISIFKKPLSPGKNSSTEFYDLLFCDDIERHKRQIKQPAIYPWVLGTLIWMLTDYGVLHEDSPSFVPWAALISLGIVLGIGLSWSLIRARSTGQIEVE